MFFEKRTHASIESVKAKEIEGNGKSILVLHPCILYTRISECFTHESIFQITFSVQGSGLKVLTLKLVFSHNI